MYALSQRLKPHIPKNSKHNPVHNLTNHPLLLIIPHFFTENFLNNRHRIISPIMCHIMEQFIPHTASLYKNVAFV